MKTNNNRDMGKFPETQNALHREYLDNIRKVTKCLTCFNLKTGAGAKAN